jgi:hypothetical protein
LSFGSLMLATYRARVKANYFVSDTVKGMDVVLTYLSESTQGGSAFHVAINSARDAYEQDVLGAVSQISKLQLGKLRDVTGIQYWRAIHTSNILQVNRYYTMHSVNLNVYVELLTSMVLAFYGGGKSWDAFGTFIQVMSPIPSLIDLIEHLIKDSTLFVIVLFLVLSDSLSLLVAVCVSDFSTARIYFLFVIGEVYLVFETNKISVSTIVCLGSLCDLCSIVFFVFCTTITILLFVVGPPCLITGDDDRTNFLPVCNNLVSVAYLPAL